MSAVDNREVRVTETEKVILAEVGEATPDSYTVFAIGFKAENDVTNDKIIRLYEQIAELVDGVGHVTMHTQGRIAVQAYDSALHLALNIEQARAAHQARNS